ncbi:MAG: serine/threonine-protein kinase [Vulcanimicrobiaceae bacterium]
MAREISLSRGLTFGGAAGSGATKQTFRVIDRSSLEFALKVFPDGQVAERERREIDAMQHCSHPNIVSLVALDIQVVNGAQHLYVIEEFLPGGTLTARVATKGLLAPRMARTLGGTLIGAIAHIASRDLVHRDIKPDNVLLRADGVTPMITDFGIVRNLRASSLTGTWQMRGPGTPAFSSPEQLNNEKNLINWRSDQFSLVVLISAVTLGMHPYQRDGETLQETVLHTLERNGPSEDFVSAATTAGLPVLIKMAAPWPVQRYRTPQALEMAWESQ